MEQLVPVDGDNELLAMEDFIQQLDKVDPQSFAFRYPTTKKGEVSVPDLRHINVRHLSEVMDSVFMVLGGLKKSSRIKGIEAWLASRFPLQIVAYGMR